MNKEKRIALLTVLIQYAEISRKVDTGLTVLGKRLIDRLCKKGKKLQEKTKLTKLESDKASYYFEKYKEIDMDSFDNETDFSAFIMTLLMLSYIVDELKDEEFRKEFMDIKLIEYINEVEKSKLRSVVMYHHKVVTKIIEV